MNSAEREQQVLLQKRADWLFQKKRSWLSERLKRSYGGKKHHLHMSSIRTFLSINIYWEKYTNSRDWNLILQIKSDLSGFFLLSVCFFLGLLGVFVCFFSSVLDVLFVFIFFQLVGFFFPHLMSNYAISLAYIYDSTGYTFTEKNKSCFASTCLHYVLWETLWC